MLEIQSRQSLLSRLLRRPASVVGTYRLGEAATFAFDIRIKKKAVHVDGTAMAVAGGRVNVSAIVSSSEGEARTSVEELPDEDFCGDDFNRIGFRTNSGEHIIWKSSEE